jgi:hypothetical protein
MVGTQMHTHPEPRHGIRFQIPGALQRVQNERHRLAGTYPVSKPVTVPQLDPVSQPASFQKSVFAGNDLSPWQTSPTAFAQHLEEP